ncbi:hypothetical protein KUCAC02_032082, partial [Chaenocephalus aceratus]
REEEEWCSCGGAAVQLCSVSGRPEGSSLYQLWTLVLQTVHHSYWEQRPPSGDPSCPQCGERPRTRAGLQTASQTRTVR